MSRIIGVISGKGGVGKTTAVVNLGAALARDFGKKVVIVDCNLTTSHLSMHLGLHRAPKTLNNVLQGEARLDEAAYVSEGMTVIPASMSTQTGEAGMHKLRATVGTLFGTADIVLLDSAPGLGKEAMPTLDASDEVLFVTNPTVPAVMDVLRCSQFANRRDTKKLGIVLNMVYGDSHELSIAEVEQLAELPVIAVIPFDREIIGSLDARKPVVTYKPNSKSGRAFVKLAARIVNEPEPKRRAPTVLLHKILRFLGMGKK